MDYMLHRAVFSRDKATVTAAWEITSYSSSSSDATDLPSSSTPSCTELDPHGNSALHCAVLLGDAKIVSHLLELGFPSDLENAHGWTPLNEALELQNRELVKVIYCFQKKHILQVVQKSRLALRDSFLDCPDFRMELGWRFTSVILGPLLRRYAPSDVYTIWKCGNKVRIDGTLRGAQNSMEKEEDIFGGGGEANNASSADASDESFEDWGKDHSEEEGEAGNDDGHRDDSGVRSNSFWNRGEFSVIYNVESEKMVLLDRVKKKAMRIKGPAEVVQPEVTVDNSMTEEEKLESEIDALFKAHLSENLDFESSDGPRKRQTREKMEMTNSALKEATNWRGLPIVETVDGWSCQQFNFTCVLKTSKQVRQTDIAALPATMTFEQYMAADLTKPTWPTVPDPGCGSESDLLQSLEEAESRDFLTAEHREQAIEKEEEEAVEVKEEKRGSSKVKTRTKEMQGRVWMAEKFPLSTSDLVPLFRILQCVNKRFKQVTLAVDRWSHKERFPVQFKLPLMYTIGILIKVSNVSLISRDSKATSEPPPAPESQASWWAKAFGSSSSVTPTPLRRIPADDEWFVIPPHYHRTVSHLKM